MFLSITTVAGPDRSGPDEGPATDLGYLLHKHPERVHSAPVAAGTAYVLYPVATAEQCTAALVLEIDPIALVRGGRGLHGARSGRGIPETFALGQYVNDRPYAASSLLAVALGAVFRTAMAGRCTARPDLLDRRWPLAVRVPALPARGAAPSGAPGLTQRLFGPLGWDVEARPVPLDETRPDWGDSRYVDLRLRGELRLADALTHLYVLLPVLDDAKHYWVGPDEVDKLLRAGQGWLSGHPERDLITRRYLAHRRALVLSAVGRLAEVDDVQPASLDNAVPDETADETDQKLDDKPAPLVRLRHEAVLAAVRRAGARRVIDWGCGGGALTRELLAVPEITEVVGVDVSVRALEVAARRLHLDRMPERARERVKLVQSSLTYTDSRLAGYDAAVLMEVVEHLDAERLPALERAVFGAARPATVVVTTPNVEHNVRYGLAEGAPRHPDHRFEWTRAQFAAWTRQLGDRYGYAVTLEHVGVDDPDVGAPTQLAVLTRVER